MRVSGNASRVRGDLQCDALDFSSISANGALHVSGRNGAVESGRQSCVPLLTCKSSVWGILWVLIWLCFAVSSLACACLRGCEIVSGKPWKPALAGGLWLSTCTLLFLGMAGFPNSTSADTVAAIAGVMTWLAFSILLSLIHDGDVYKLTFACFCLCAIHLLCDLCLGWRPLHAACRFWTCAWQVYLVFTSVRFEIHLRLRPTS